jgi:hypothetical protein
MLRRHRAQALQDGGRPHRRVVTNLLAMQARLRGDVVVPVHPSARVLPAALPDGLPLSQEIEEVADEASVAPVLALPGAATAPVRNPGGPDVHEAIQRLEELEVRLEGLQTDLFALVDRLDPDGGPGGRRHGSPEEAIVRLQRLIDRRLGSS